MSDDEVFEEEVFEDAEDFQLPWAPSKRETTRYYDLFKRDPIRDKFYRSKEWKDVRGLKIKKNPMCEACDARGILIKPARHVHHVEPIDTEEGWAKRLVITNLQSLCLPCHNRVKRDTSGS